MNDNISGAVLLAGNLLAAVFAALKTCHVIGWSWWWVLSPIWIGVIFFALVMLFTMIRRWHCR